MTPNTPWATADSVRLMFSRTIHLGNEVLRNASHGDPEVALTACGISLRPSNGYGAITIGAAAADNNPASICARCRAVHRVEAARALLDTAMHADGDLGGCCGEVTA